MDVEEDGNVYIKQVVVTLKALNKDIDHNLKVKNILDEIDSCEKTSVNLEEFKELMGMLEEAGWRKQKPKKAKEITDMDLKAVFRLVDVDKSGNISRTEAKMAAKLLMKRFGIKDVPTWMREFDENSDGRLSYKEFKMAILPPTDPETEVPEVEEEDRPIKVE